MPLSISVILTVYNGERSVVDSLLSLMHQSYPAKEIIVVDDGSTDKTPLLVDKLVRDNPKSPIMVIRQKNQGRGHARNNGAKKASGDIITFCEDDAWYSPEYLASAVRHFADPSVGGIIGPHYVWNRDDSIWTRFKDIERRRNFYHYRPNSCWFYRRKDFENLGRFDTSLEMVEDTLPGRMLKERGKKLIFEPKSLWLHREPSTLRAYLRRKYRGGLGLAMLYKNGSIPFPISNYFLMVILLGLGSIAGLIAFLLWRPTVWRFILALVFLLLVLALVRIRDITISLKTAKDSLAMILLSLYAEYLLLGATFVGVLYGLTMKKTEINHVLKGR